MWFGGTCSLMIKCIGVFGHANRVARIENATVGVLCTRTRTVNPARALSVPAASLTHLQASLSIDDQFLVHDTIVAAITYEPRRRHVM